MTGGITVNYRYLRELFESCLEADYRHVENGGSFATVRDGDILYIFLRKATDEDWFNNLSYHAVSTESLIKMLPHFCK